MGIDLRRILAQEVAEQIGAEVQPEVCDICRYPLIMKADQGLAFCWFCATDRRAAHEGRTALTKARMAANGIFIVDENIHPALARQREQESSWPEGWAL